MLHTKFHGNRSNDSGEDNFLRGFNIYGHGGHLGHVTSIMSLNFNFLVPKTYIQNLVQNGPLFLRKASFLIIFYVNDLGPRSTHSTSTNFQVTGCNSF